MTTLVFAGLTVALVSGLLWRRHALDKARRQTLEGLAGRLNSTFSEADNFGLLAQLRDFDLFSRERRWLGRKGKIRNVLRRQFGKTQVFMFDYTYVVSTGKSSKRITQTVCFADNKDWYLPNFKLKPETWWRKALAMFDKSDINFPDSPDFSDKFWLTGEFESLVRKTFNPELQEFLIERPPVHLEGNNYYLLAYKPRKALQADEAHVFFEHFCQLVELLQKKEGQLELLNLAELQPEKVELRRDDQSA
ncbi:MAG: hypothetical protein H6574_08745 [Lewinellaceae bacterium]|nr:hypothetical protein [Saprospiraceae bacterium]MCB9315475.1 hypothetical protein [Lewinellaceae bacterium]MCB9331153.1 hypothetical protein [Lewinellaceae bacterium]